MGIGGLDALGASGSNAKDVAKMKLESHKAELQATKQRAEGMNRGVSKDIWDAIVVTAEAQVEVMQAIVDALPDNQLLA